MADPSGVSLGEGIGLQGRTDIRGGVKDILRNDEVRLKRKAAQDSLRAKQDHRNEDALSKLSKDIYIDPTKIHPTLVPDAQRVSAQAMNELMTTYANDPNTIGRTGISILEKAKGDMAGLNGESQNLWAFEKTPDDQLTDEAVKAKQLLRASYGKGKDAFYNSVKDLPAQSLGYFDVAPTGGVSWKNKPKDTDVTKRVMSMFKDQAATNDAVVVDKGPAGGNQRLFNIEQTATDDQKSTGLVNLFKTQPDALEAYRLNNKDRILSGQLKDDPEAILNDALVNYGKMDGRISRPELRTIPQPSAAERKKKNYGWDGNDWNNSRFAVRPTAQDAGGQMKEGSGYEVQDLTANENSFREVWKAPYALNADTGKKSKSFAGEVQGAFTGTVIRRNPETNKMEWYAKIVEPSISTPITTQTQEAKGVTSTSTRTIQPQIVPPLTHLIPYDNIKGKVEAYTAGKDAEGGFKLRPEDYQRVDEINNKIDKGEKAYTRAELKALSSAYTDDVIDNAVKAGRIKLK